MQARERVITALACKKPDVVPYMYSMIDTRLQEEILGRPIDIYRYSTDIDPGIIATPGDDIQYEVHYTVHPETARKLNLDAIGIKFPSPLFCLTNWDDSAGHSIKQSLLISSDKLKMIKMPDPDNEQIYLHAKEFVDRFQEEFAVYASIRLGASSTLMSMGYEVFSYMLYDDIDFVYEVVNLYTDWMNKIVKNLSEIGFDFMWAFDDIAFKGGPLFSKTVWKDVFFPRLKKVADNIQCPWIFHSDGNILPLLDELIPLGMSGIHPLEPGTMDLDYLKLEYGKKLCLIGNIDINYTLSKGTIHEVESEVRERIKQLSQNGGYIISDSNSVPYFCKANNIIAMSNAVQKYKNCY